MQNVNLITAILGAIIFLMVFWNVIIQISLLKIKSRQKILFSGKKGGDLEQIIIESRKKIESLDGDVQDLYDVTGKIHALALRGVHKTSVIRFNPFRDFGGDQSFSVALLDAHNNGVVISSLYSRDGVRVYAKAIENGLSPKYPLTEEEKEAIKKANTKKVNKAQG